VRVICSGNVATVYALIEKNVTTVVRIVRACSFTVLTETVHRSMGTNP